MARLLQDIGFVHLHVHSSYSLLEGALKIAKLAELAKADRQPALALTDTNNLFGALEFSEKLAGSGIQPIPGVQLSVCFEEADPVARIVPVPTNIVLLAQTEEGYRNLMRLVSHAYFGVPLGDAPSVAAPALSAHCEGLIALTGGLTGPLDTALRDGGRPMSPQRVSTFSSTRSATSSTSKSSVTARRGAAGRGRADRSRRPQWIAAGRHQRAVFRQARRFRGA